MNVLFLIGFMGSGKSTVAEALSHAMQCDYVDIDSLIVEKSGKSINEIFAQHGEEFFRELETKTLQEIQPKGDLVVATGGGCVERSENLEFMKRIGTSVYLQASWDEIINRIAESNTRPLAIADDNWSETKSRFQRRLPFYESADIVIDTSGKSPVFIANEIITRLNP